MQPVDARRRRACGRSEPGRGRSFEGRVRGCGAGAYDIVRTDGEIDKLVVHPGMTWSMVPAKGEPSGGTIFAQGGKNCFVTEGVEGHRCFSGTAPAPDGSMTVTGDDGESATVRPSTS
jgi:hypothetical protein